jgi:acetylornithine deacetylase
VSSALTLARQEELVGFGGLSGIRLNIGRIEGGIKPNMIAGSTLVRGAMRLTPAHDPQEIVAKLRALSPAEYLESFEVTFQGPSLPALRGAEAERQRACAEGWLDELRLPKGDAQDFWSEAAIFSEAGIPSVMLGPGSIAQAHQAGEWVSLLSLEDVTKTYMRIIDGGQ